MSDSRFRKLLRNKFVFLDGGSTKQNRLSFFLPFLYFLYNRLPFCLGVFVNQIRQIFSRQRFVARNADYFKIVNFMEFFCRCLRSSGHSGYLFIKTEIILNGYFGVGTRFFFNLNAFFGFDCLMQSAAVTASVKHASREFVDDNGLAVFDDVIFVALEKRLRLQTFFKIMHKAEIFRRVKIVHADKFFHFFYSDSGDTYSFEFFLNRIIFINH